LSDLTWFINMHSGNEEWFHSEYMKRAGSIAR
jgi:hypothetical protein